MEPKNDDNSRKIPPAPLPRKAEETAVIKFARDSRTASNSAIIPSLFVPGYGTYEVRPESFLFSVLTHTIVILAILWIVHLAVPTKPLEHVTLNATPLEPYMPMHIGRAAGGGGGGGDASKLQVSAGTPPRATLKPQIVPVTVIPTKQQPKIAVEQTIVADMRITPSAQIGDPLSKAMVLSNGTGVRSGAGSGSGGGLGSGDGRGIGAGSGGNFGGGVFRVGNGVSAPKPIFTPDPDYSDEARKAKYQGVVVLTIIVGPDGRVHDPSVTRSLGMGLDEKAKEKVLTWKFEPANKDGRPVPVQMLVEVNFNLY